MSEHIQISSDDILIRAQDTPNPNAIKFIVNYALKDVGNATFVNRDECKDLPLAAALFDIPGIVQVYFFQNTLTVTHNDELPESILKDQVRLVIKTRLPIHNPGFTSAEEVTVKPLPDRSSLSPELREIEEILDRTIRPGLQSDGGDLEVLEFKDHDLRVLYHGACGGCPSSMMGTLDAIQSILRHELNDDQLTVTPI